MATRRLRAGASNSSGATHNEVESELKCECGFPSPTITAKTPQNAGRRFNGCGDPNGPTCRFFIWVDPEIPYHARNMLYHLLQRNQALSEAVSESSQSRCEESDLRSLVAELKAELKQVKKGSRSTIAELKEELTQEKKGKIVYKWAFVLCICYMIMSSFCNINVNEKYLSLP